MSIQMMVRYTGLESYSKIFAFFVIKFRFYLKIIASGHSTAERRDPFCDASLRPFLRHFFKNFSRTTFNSQLNNLILKYFQRIQFICIHHIN